MKIGRSCSHVLADAPARITSPPLFSRSVSGWDEVRPWLVAMLQRQRLLRLAPHTMLRIVFVAVDRTDEERSVTHSHDAQGLGLTADAVRYLRALLRCSFGPLGRVRIASLMGGRDRCTGGGQSDGYGAHQRPVARFVGRVLPEQITFPDQPLSYLPVREGGCEPEHGDLRRVA